MIPRLLVAAELLLFAASGSFLTACGSVVLDQRIEAKANDWAFTVKSVRDGPNSYVSTRGPGPAERWVPPGHHRFLIFTVSLRNDARARRSFHYEDCDLDDPGHDKVFLPVIVDRNVLVNLPILDKSDDVDSGESVSRMLYYAYPEDRYPTRLDCGGKLVLPLPFEGGR
ncbi:DUF4352 domain-containing protein [Pendulispora brunnea]|uniref:DUF4352 domain-containing protein n=1 Tax=Pendulispora brunnea TaxID=2905690 RepID=A0ABZ2K4N1_9BACT